MRLNSLSTADFADLLATDSAAPGGGAAAAFIGAQGAALVAMVAGLTVGREKYHQFEELARDTREKALIVKDCLLLTMDKDYEAYKSVTAVFSMPKETQGDKDKRKTAMQKALEACTLTPYETMVYASQGIRLAHALMGKSNSNAASDLGVAALSLKAALDGAWLNVLTNLKSIDDRWFAAKYRQQGEALRAESLALAKEVSDWLQAGF